MARQIPQLFRLIQDLDRRAEVAQASETSGDYLYQIATGRRIASAALAERIELATGIPREVIRPGREWATLPDGRKVDIGAITRSDLRPNIWPEGDTGQEAA